MIRRPPRSTLFPYPTLCRSALRLPFVLRALSASLAIGTAALAYLIAVRLWDRTTAILAVILLLSHRYFLHSGIEIQDRKSTRLNSSHANISYAVFCLKKNKP